MLKKILTLCLVLCMLASVPAFAALEDIAGEKFEKEISLLNSIGIVEGKEANAYKPADKLTRAEMTTIVLRLIDVEPNAPAAFEDVAADHWANKIIGTAAQLGIINGMSATTFAPEENVTYPQAAKMLVCTLGYGVKAEGLGGYPTGYIAVASQLGVLKSTSDDGQPISRAVMAKMVANCLEVDLMERTGYGSEVTFEPQDGVNLLNKYLDVVVFENEIIDGSYTLNLGGASCEEDEVAIGTDVIKVGETNAASFIGRAVNLYAKEDKDEETLTAIHVEAVKNSEYFTIDAEDVLPSTSATELWWDNGSTKEMFEIAGTCTFVNNGGVVAPMDLTAVSGKITVSSADGQEADIIFVESYQDAVVAKVSKTSGLITFKAPILNPSGTAISTITLNEENESVKFSITDKEGNAVAVKDLKEWDVLSITMNEAQTLYNIVLSRDEFQGKITEYNVNDDEVVVNTKTYDIAATLVDADGDAVPTAVGLEAKFFLNAYGKIVACNTEGIKAFNYGYIVLYHKGEGMEGKETVKIFTEDGVMKVFTLAEDYTIIAADTEVESLSFESGSLSAEMLLKYRTNKDGEIYEFETLDAPKTGLGNLIGGSRSFQNGGYILPDNTKIFKVPPTYTGEDSFYSISLGSAAAHWTSPMNYAYEIDKDMQIGVGLSKRNNAALANAIGVVDKVSLTYKDGNEVTRIRLVGGKILDFNEFSKIQYRMTAFTSEKDVPNRLDRQYGGSNAQAWRDPSNTVVFEDELGNPLSASDLNKGDVIFYASPDQAGVTGMIKIIFRAEHAPYVAPYAELAAVQTGLTEEMYNNTPFYANRSMGFDDDGKGYISAGGYNLYSMYYVDHMDTLTSKTLSFRTIGYQTQKRAPWMIDYWQTTSGSVTGGTAYVAPETKTLNFEKVRSCYLYDMERGTIVESSVAEITEEDKVFFRESNGTPVLVVIYRNMPAQ